MDYSELKLLYKDGFPEDSDSFIDYFFSDYIKDDNIIAYKENGKIVSAGYIIEKNAVLFAKKAVFPYLTALSTLCNCRGQGKLRNIMESAYKMLRERGYAYFGLMPFSHEYYKRFSLNNISFAAEKTITGGKVFSMRELTEKDFPSAINIHNQMTKHYNSRLVLDTVVLAQKVKDFSADGIKGMILSDGDGDKAFAFYNKGKIGFYAALDIEEFCSTENLKDTTFYDYSASAAPHLQGRIIDAKKALLDYPYDKALDKQFSFRLYDAQIPENNFTAKIEIIDGKAYLSKTKNYEYEFDIAYLTQIMFTGGAVFKHCNNYFPDMY